MTSSLELLADLPRRGRLVPARDPAGELPPPAGVLAAVAAIAAVQQEVHRRGADRAGHRAADDVASDAGTPTWLMRTASW